MDHVEPRFFKAVCLDKRCQSVLYFSTTDKIVECHQCGQRHNKSRLQDVREASVDTTGAFQNYVYRMLVTRGIPKRGPEMVKVLGLSNYYCKILSPLLTRYGMDKNTGRAKLLTEMNQGEILDCGLFGDRAFMIEPEHVTIAGYGKDVTGSLDYLSETLRLIVSANEGEERLIPIHADGDGHCLVHAVSRALVGRELFWHPLRCCLKQHFKTNIDKYKELFKDFIDTDEWASIIEECDPNFQPPDGELHGLRNIHIFGLANVLKRPIILLDSLECMQKCGDYSALFLPGFVSPEDCRGKDDALNKPICIAWSSYSHNHYIPLVGIQELPLPVLPSVLLPKVWGMPQNIIHSYIEFDSNKNCVIGGNRALSHAYIQRLVHAMEVLYYEKHGVHPSLVADAKLYLFPDNILFTVKPAAVLERAKSAVREGRLFRCLMCRALCELPTEEKWLPNNSAVCSPYLQNYKRLPQDPASRLRDIVLKYDSTQGSFVIDLNNVELQACTFCKNQSSLRKVTSDGTVIYRGEDKDTLDRNIWNYDQERRYTTEGNVTQRSTKDTRPAKMLLKVKWNGREVEDEIPYFDYRHSTKESSNEFVKELSRKLTEKHFSDTSSDKELRAYVSEEIWKVLRKWDYKNTSDAPSMSEVKRQEFSKSQKLENASGAQPKTYSEIQYIRVVTSNGQQANLPLNDEGLSFGQLQEWIKQEFNIPVKSQVIKKGFPPRPIKPCGDTNKQMLTDLRHGDRITVEIQRKEESSCSSYSAASKKNTLKDTIPKRSVLKDTTTKRNILKSPNNIFPEPSTSMTKPSYVGPDDISWESIKQCAKHFRLGGFIYKKIAVNHILNASLHTSLDEYPNKVFCYNPMSHNIELCVKPYGHFLISSDLEERIDDVKKGNFTVGFTACPEIEEEEENIHFQRTLENDSYANSLATNQNLESQRNPNRKMGPGFSIIRPDMDSDKDSDMDLS